MCGGGTKVGCVTPENDWSYFAVVMYTASSRERRVVIISLGIDMSTLYYSTVVVPFSIMLVKINFRVACVGLFINIC